MGLSHPGYKVMGCTFFFGFRLAEFSKYSPGRILGVPAYRGTPTGGCISLAWSRAYIPGCLGPTSCTKRKPPQCFMGCEGGAVLEGCPNGQQDYLTHKNLGLPGSTETDSFFKTSSRQSGRQRLWQMSDKQISVYG